MKFNDLTFKSTGLNNQAKHTFDNKYGVSVIIGEYTYGGPDGLYELAVTDSQGLCYDSSITTDVIGNLTEADVSALLVRVEALEPKAEQS